MDLLKSFLEHKIMETNQKPKCPKCKSYNVKLIELLRYCTPNDLNPVEYKCKDCDNIFTILE